ncbi:HNH endonuclease [Brevibacillus halotolerans]|nr:HNH endonuclease [Brevibacillus halotolerans]
METHHIQWLSRYGADSIENTVALCPNCHRKMHILDLEEDVRFLKQKISN